MKCGMLCEIIRNSSLDLYDCHVRNDYVVLTTPFVLPDGDLVDVFISIGADGSFVVSDCGETLRYLYDNDFDPMSTEKRKDILSSTLNYFGIELRNGELRKHVTTNSDLFGTIFDMGQCIGRIVDLLYTKRSARKVSFRETVMDYLEESNIEYEPDYEVVAGNGVVYAVDFSVWSKSGYQSLVSLVTTSSPQNANSAVSRAVRMWTDIKNNKDVKSTAISVVDDTSPIWKPEMIASLGFVSNVYMWSKRDLLKKDLA